MKIRYISDLHLEFMNNSKYTISVMDNEQDMVLVLAGDIVVVSPEPFDEHYSTGVSKYFDLVFHPFIKEMCTRFKAVVMVMGNHEHWYGNIEDTANLIRSRFTDNANFHLLDDSYVTIDDVVFLGGTLWGDCGGIEQMSPYAPMHFNGMRDNLIKVDNNVKFSAQKMWEYHKRSANKLQEIIDELSDYQKVVLVTHHAPTYLSVGYNYTHHPLNIFFASSTLSDELALGGKIKVAIHGHMHDNKDYFLYQTRIVCNPRGYHGYKVNADFDDTKTVEV